MINVFLDKLKLAYHQHKRSFATFLLTGIGTTVIFVGLSSLFIYGLHSNPIIGMSIAFALGATFQFFANRKITFRVQNGYLLPQILKYLTLLLINYLVSILILQLAIWLVASPFIGLIAAAGINPITGYVLFKYWVFKHPITA